MRSHRQLSKDAKIFIILNNSFEASEKFQINNSKFQISRLMFILICEIVDEFILINNSGTV